MRKAAVEGKGQSIIIELSKSGTPDTVFEGTAFPAMPVSMGIGSEGVKGNDVATHRAYEEKIGLRIINGKDKEVSVIDKLGQEVGAQKKIVIIDGKEVEVWDFAAKLEGVKAGANGLKVLLTEHGAIALEADGIVSIQDDRFGGGHAFRGRYGALAVCGATRGEIEHELLELRLWLGYALNPGEGVAPIATQAEIDAGLLGVLIDQRLAEDPVRMIAKKWQFHMEALGAQAEFEKWDDIKLAQEMDKAKETLAEEEGQMHREGLMQILATLSQERTAIRVLSEQNAIDQAKHDTKEGDMSVRALRVRKMAERTRDITARQITVDVLEAEKTKISGPASLTIASGPNNGNGDKKNVGGISEEGLTVKMQGDGTRIPMFKGVPLDTKNFTGFDFKVSQLKRNQTSEQLVMASAI